MFNKVNRKKKTMKNKIIVLGLLCSIAIINSRIELPSFENNELKFGISDLFEMPVAHAQEGYPCNASSPNCQIENQKQQTYYRSCQIVVGYNVYGYPIYQDGELGYCSGGDVEDCSPYGCTPDCSAGMSTC